MVIQDSIDDVLATPMGTEHIPQCHAVPKMDVDLIPRTYTWKPPYVPTEKEPPEWLPYVKLIGGFILFAYVLLKLLEWKDYSY